MPSKRIIVCLGISFLLSLVATGCVETAMMFHGNSITPAMNIVALQEGVTQTETWETFDIRINYKLSQNGEVLDLSGQAVLSEHYKANYASLRKLFVYLFFLDENSQVLRTINLVRAMTGSLEEVLTFSSQHPVPAGATSLSFGYDGAADGTLMSPPTTFYELPLSKK